MYDYRLLARYTTVKLPLALNILHCSPDKKAQNDPSVGFGFSAFRKKTLSVNGEQ